MDDGTTRAACSLFLRATDNQWVYRGIYELASSGELALDLPAPSANSVDPRLRAAVEARIDPPKTREGHQMLNGWGWPLPAASSNREEQKKALWTDLDAGDAEPVLSYLVLRCIGWSEHDFKVWEMNRNASQKRKFPQPLSKLSHISHLPDFSTLIRQGRQLDGLRLRDPAYLRHRWRGCALPGRTRLVHAVNAERRGSVAYI